MKPKIMVVDNDTESRNLIKRILLRLNYEVSLSETGLQAIEKAGRERFSLVLCDATMYGSDWLKTLTGIKKINQHLPIIMMSGCSTHDLVIETLNKGAVDFIAKPVNLPQLGRIINDVLRCALSSTGCPTIQRLSKDDCLKSLRTVITYLEEKFIYLKDHSQRVAGYSIEIASALNVDKPANEVIEYAAQLHDVGKACVKDIILSKSGKLDDAEWVEIRMHPDLGSRMVGQLKIFRAEEPLIRHHHERYDGRGYPDGLRGEKIPMGARIIALADAYDAMVSPRPYHAPIPSQKAKETIRQNSGKQFDPKLVEVFLKIV